MLNRRPDPLSWNNTDFYPYEEHYYDVFYSDADGTFNPSGRYISIEAVYSYPLPAEGGLNIAEVWVWFTEWGWRHTSVVASYVALGNNAAPESVGNIVDGDLMTWTAMGNTAGMTRRLRVTVGFEQPNQPPNCAGATAASIWPPNHDFVPVSIAGVDDPDGDPVAIEITSVFQDEPLDSLGDGHFSPDAQITDGSASLRAERSGLGDGRVYHLAFTASDGRGGVCEGSTTVCVPHDQGSGSECVDQGAFYDSTAP